MKESSTVLHNGVTVSVCNKELHMTVEEASTLRNQLSAVLPAWDNSELGLTQQVPYPIRTNDNWIVNS